MNSYMSYIPEINLDLHNLNPSKKKSFLRVTISFNGLLSRIERLEQKFL